jgi:hypothetical protein
MRIAFKEWAIVVDALGRGEQILLLRKGGIHEGRSGLQMSHRDFLLFPTLYHQQRDSVIPAAQARYDAIAPYFPSGKVVRIEFFAQVTAWHRFEETEVIQRLAGQHVWREEVIADRFKWGKAAGILAMVLRVFRLRDVVELPLRPEYSGCKSWVELARDVCTDGAEAVLGDRDFEQRMEAFRAAGQLSAV